MSTRSNATAKTATHNRVLLEISPRSAVDRLTGVTDDVLIERGERKWFTKAESEALLNLEFDGVRVLQTALSEE